MRKKYEKPMMMVENFNMDIDILAGGDVYGYWELYEAVGYFGLEDKPTREGYEIWLAAGIKDGEYDTPTSGECYYTIRMS